MRKCTLCEKSYKMGGTRKLLRGHYNRTNWSQKKANIQWTTPPGSDRRVKACTRCIRTLAKKA